MQGEIVRRAIGERKKLHFLRYFNEQMGVYGISRVTLDKWLKEESHPDPRILQRAVEVYPDDPRGQMAAQLLELGKERA